MKKSILLLLSIAFTFSSFSSNMNVNSNKPNDDAWIAFCSRTIRNFETGETQNIPGSGQGATQEEASANCLANATANAQAVIDFLNAID